MYSLNQDLLPGTLYMMILRTLNQGPMHGYAIAKRIRDQGDLEIEDGSLYPALNRMLIKGWVKAEWGMTDNNRRARFYSLTPLGRGRLRSELPEATRGFLELAGSRRCEKRSRPGLGSGALISRSHCSPVTGLRVASALSLVTINVWAEPKDAKSTTPNVPVCIAESEDPAIASRAKVIAEHILKSAGIKLAWRRISDCPAMGIRVRFDVSAPESERPGALGYAFPYEGHTIVILYHRVRALVATDSRDLQFQVSAILAHVLAHEIVHLLQAVVRHSESGIMKAKFTKSDLQDMTRGTLRFAPEDLDLLAARLHKPSSPVLASAEEQPPLIAGRR